MDSARPAPKLILSLLLMDSAVEVRLAPAAPTTAALVLLCANEKLLGVGVALAASDAFSVLEAAVAAVVVELELALVDCVLDD